ncbi:hypothetical protein M6B38_306365 [Iris pallida]|uniref:Uncharacterized protein n=1 Tax=Iris pallida TaxID=29817 RepID=A0AAX6HKB1_IRIPA|nr:hypothetical protein M6B38_306365 [Iris pallida]
MFYLSLSCSTLDMIESVSVMSPPFGEYKLLRDILLDVCDLGQRSTVGTAA